MTQSHHGGPAMTNDEQMPELDAAIERLKAATPKTAPWTVWDFSDRGEVPIDKEIAIILNAVVSGELTRADLCASGQQVRALALLEAARFIETMEQVDPPEPMTAEMLKAVAGAGLRNMAKRLAPLTPAPQPEGEPVTLTYTNWRGETAQRTITPKRIWWGATDWHPEPQWLLTAFDAEKQADRDFALKDFGAAAPQPAEEAVLREIIDWCHLQPGNYPNWMDRARQAVGDFEGDPGQPPQPSASVVETLRELVAACEAYPVNIPRADAALDNAHAVLRALKGGA